MRVCFSFMQLFYASMILLFFLYVYVYACEYDVFMHAGMHTALYTHTS